MSESMQAFYHELEEQRRQAHGARQNAATSTTSASRTTQTATQGSALGAIAPWTPAEETDVLDAIMRGEFDVDTHASQREMPEQPDS
ncbi:uncharacterized protein JCM10292_007405 [Rhodotorula paludigena]|uniref:uncharacterized protein n=1 Tax=Rhodotorula paludigena TaxID=86838 RepID=UPI00316B6766